MSSITDEQINAFFASVKPIVTPPDSPLVFRRDAKAAPKRRRHNDLGQGKRYRILARDGFRCQLCGATAQDGAQLEVDHRVSVADGGKATDDNLWTLCRPCNRGKGAKSL